MCAEADLRCNSCTSRHEELIANSVLCVWRCVRILTSKLIHAHKETKTLSQAVRRARGGVRRRTSKSIHACEAVKNSLQTVCREHGECAKATLHLSSGACWGEEPNRSTHMFHLSKAVFVQVSVAPPQEHGWRARASTPHLALDTERQPECLI